MSEALINISTQESTSHASFDAFVTYCSDRAAEIHAQPLEQPTPTADGRGLHFDKLTLYHGSPVSGIENLHVAEDYTIGEGIYGTYDPTGAIGYALVRSHHDKDLTASPVLYELEITDISLIDLREPEAIVEFLGGFKSALESRVHELEASPDESTNMQHWFTRLLRELAGSDDEQIKAHPRFWLKSMNRSGLIKEYVESLGFQGVIGEEGGEDSVNHTIGRHESWVIFDPNKVVITNEEGFIDPNPPEKTTPVQRGPDEKWWG